MPARQGGQGKRRLEMNPRGLATRRARRSGGMAPVGIRKAAQGSRARSRPALMIRTISSRQGLGDTDTRARDGGIATAWPPDCRKAPHHGPAPRTAVLFAPPTLRLSRGGATTLA
ncbi:hypothetical protein GCM10011324_04580 [Allosediminivita pacifica]|nr:hypothetical protein GCM10011324_04580 [Allosediminivita pacifica]